MDGAATERLILVVEDHPEHAQLIQSVFAESSEAHRLLIVTDTQTALDVLYRQGDYSSEPRPDLILLNLDLPDQSGPAMLAEIKAHPQLHRIPIVVLTRSNCEIDIFKTYHLQGNSYVVKVSDLNQLNQIVQRIEEFWLGIVTLPLE